MQNQTKKNEIKMTKWALGIAASVAVLGYSHASLAAHEADAKASSHGYFVESDEAQGRGGVGNYVPMSTSAERARQARLEELARFAEIKREKDDQLAIQLSGNILFD